MMTLMSILERSGREEDTEVIDRKGRGTLAEEWEKRKVLVRPDRDQWREAWRPDIQKQKQAGGNQAAGLPDLLG